MIQIDQFAVGYVGNWVIKKIVDQYLSVPLILKVPWLKHKGMVHEYEESQSIMNYWKDLLGWNFGLENDAKKILHEYHCVIFRDVIVTDFVPRAPGYYYSRELWNDPKNALLSLGVLRIIPNEIAKPKRLLALHKPPEFEAHADIEKGIPIVVSEEVYQKLSEQLNNYGSAHVDEIVATMSDVGLYQKCFESAGIPSTYPVVKSKKMVKHVGDPIPIMGNGWVIYNTQRSCDYLNYRFWTGIDYYSDSLQGAKVKLKKLIPNDGQVDRRFNFDQKIPYF